MEKLEELLRNYNLAHTDDLKISPWSKQYCKKPFPKYWKTVFQIMKGIDRNYRVLEIGCGQGDVTTIFCYLGFKKIESFEKLSALAVNARRRVNDLFNRTDVIFHGEFSIGQHIDCDVLVLVNCAYKDLAVSKHDYEKLMKDYYTAAGSPQYFIMEVIDSSYTLSDEEFPEHIRLSQEDVIRMFPDFKIQSWKTYIYPENRKSKTLYLIEKK